MAVRPDVKGEPTPEEARALKGAKYYADWDSGYSKQQSTRPQTLGYGLTDSPSGSGAWILEKFLGLDRLQRRSAQHRQPRRNCWNTSCCIG